MEPPIYINADKGKQAGQLSDDPLSCVFTEDTLYVIVDSVDDLSYGRRFVCACLPGKAGMVYLGTLGLVES